MFLFTKKWQVGIIKFNVQKIFYSMINMRIILYNEIEKLHFYYAFKEISKKYIYLHEYLAFTKQVATK